MFNKLKLKVQLSIIYSRGVHIKRYSPAEETLHATLHWGQGKFRYS